MNTRLVDVLDRITVGGLLIFCLSVVAGMLIVDWYFTKMHKRK
jgi:hypothetical protein